MYNDTMHGLLMQLSTCTLKIPDIMVIVIYKNHYEYFGVISLWKP